MELADRRSRASQLRMRSIANLASDTPTGKRRRRGQEGMWITYGLSKGVKLTYRLSYRGYIWC